MSLDFYLYSHPDDESEQFWINITHNLNKMADEAGIYEALWRPEEIDATKACDIIPLLETAITEMIADPERFKAHNPPNGWGSYDSFLADVRQVLKACKQFPHCIIYTCR